jgi:hypothetical protein
MVDTGSLHALMRRWGKGVRLIAAAWFVLLMHAWLRRHIGATDVLVFGAVPAAIYWTIGRALVRWRTRSGF